MANGGLWPRSESAWVSKPLDEIASIVKPDTILG